MAGITDFLTRDQEGIPQQEIGIGGFTALVRVRDSYKLTSEIPKTYVEDGSHSNDHVIRNPITLSIQGSVSDIHRRASQGIKQLQEVQAEIGNLTNQYAPARTQSQISQINALANDVNDAILQADAALAAGDQALSFFGNKDEESKSLQEQFLDAMEALHFGGQLIAIDMPFRRHENMVITSFQKDTDNEVDETTFSIEAQQFRFSELRFVEIGTLAGGLGGQADAEVSKGAQEGEPVEQSLATQILTAISGGV